jgi:hypothetical protein
MKKKIATVGFELGDGQSELISLGDGRSFFDFDIIIVDPQIPFSFVQFSNYFQGKSSLDDTMSFRLKESLSQLRREIESVLETGKTVIFLMNKSEEVYVDSGRRSVSGTGRNAQTTRHVELLSNYGWLLPGLKIVNGLGQEMKLHPGASVLSQYWQLFGKESEYRVYFETQNMIPLVKTRSGEKTVGAWGKNIGEKASNLVLLPYVDFERQEFQTENPTPYSSEILWTPEGKKFCVMFIQQVLDLDKALTEGKEPTLAPIWSEAPDFLVGDELEIKKAISEIDTSIANLKTEQANAMSKLDEEIKIKQLLYEQGKPLENAIIKGLEILGFSARNFTDAKSEFDVVFESSEGRLLGEAEGKDNKAIAIDKLRQLNGNVTEDLLKEGNTVKAKGILFGNAFRMSKPEDRGSFFTEKCVDSANQFGIGLVSTVDMFRVCQYVLRSNDVAFAKLCREKLVQATGIFLFPEVP